MYNALTSFESAGSKGSTRLHMDIADAVNIMLYATPAPGALGEEACAVWDLFRAEDADVLRDFLRERFGEPSHDDPIHSQSHYLDVELRTALFKEKGILSHRIYQHPGEAVFIPAGCAHQVYIYYCACSWTFH
jgi:[histone H3]-dimethyl-L-lysine9 demethylase